MNKKGKNGFLKKLTLCAVSVTMMFSAVGCSKNNSSSGQNGPTTSSMANVKVAVICKNDTVDFWESVHQGAEAACDELGMELMYRCASGDNDYASQIGFIKEAIEWEANAIIIAPNGVTELNDAFEEAEKAGISILNINSKADYENIKTLIRSSDSDGGAVAAKNAVDIMFNATTSDGFDLAKATSQKVGIVAHSAATADERVNAFKTNFGTQLGYVIEDYKSMLAASDEGGAPAEGGASGEEGASAEGGAMSSRDPSETAKMVEGFMVEAAERCSSRESSKEAAINLIKANPSIRVMYGTNTNTTLGICDAIKELEKEDSIIAVGFNSSEEELNYIRQGILKGTVIQNPYNMGYVSATTARSIVSGSLVVPVIDMGVTFVDADNLNDDLTQLMLYPEKFS